MKAGVIIGIRRSDQSPVVVGQAGPLSEVSRQIKSLRSDADLEREYLRLELWTNRGAKAVKLKQPPVAEESPAAPGKASRKRPARKRAKRSEKSDESDKSTAAKAEGEDLELS